MPCETNFSHLTVKMSSHIYLAHSEFDKECSSTLRNLLSDDVFTDVTLVADDGNAVKAHKVVLSAGSEFLRKVLKYNQHPHPLIHILGVSGTILKNMIQFMYLGEVKISEIDLEKFMFVAKMMKVKGLCATNSDLEESSVDEEIIKFEEDNTKSVYDEEQSEGSKLENLSIASPTNLIEKTIKAAQENLYDPKVDYGREFVLKPVKRSKVFKDLTSSSNVANAPEFSLTRWHLKGGHNIPSQLVTHQELRYLFSKANKEFTRLTFSCATKHVTKCAAKCKMQVLVDTSTGERRMDLMKWSNVEDHNHQTSKADIMIMDMKTRIDEISLIDLFEKPETIRGRVIEEYKDIFGALPEWPGVVEHLEKNVEVLTRRVARNRQKLINEER